MINCERTLKRCKTRHLTSLPIVSAGRYGAEFPVGAGACGKQARNQQALFDRFLRDGGPAYRQRISRVPCYNYNANTLGHARSSLRDYAVGFSDSCDRSKDAAIPTCQESSTMRTHKPSRLISDDSLLILSISPEQECGRPIEVRALWRRCTIGSLECLLCVRINRIV
jgi:hypothetical protein